VRLYENQTSAGKATVKYMMINVYVYFFRNVGVVSPFWNSLFNERVVLLCNQN